MRDWRPPRHGCPADIHRRRAGVSARRIRAQALNLKRGGTTDGTKSTTVWGGVRTLVVRQEPISSEERGMAGLSRNGAKFVSTAMVAALLAAACGTSATSAPASAAAGSVAPA